MHEAGESGEFAVKRRDVDEDILVGGRVVEVVREDDLARGICCRVAPCRGARRVEVGGREHVPGPGERSGVCSVLLIASLEKDHSDVERESGNEKHDRQGNSEQREDLTAFPGMFSC